MIRLYRCLICGNVHAGVGDLKNCPFCGSPSRFLVDPVDWWDENEELPASLSAWTRERLAPMLQAEANDGAYYYRAYRRASSRAAVGLFRYLWRIEREHQPVLHRLLREAMPKPEPTDVEPPEGDVAVLTDARVREVAAHAFYREIAEGRRNGACVVSARRSPRWRRTMPRMKPTWRRRSGTEPSAPCSWHRSWWEAAGHGSQAAFACRMFAR